MTSGRNGQLPLHASGSCTQWLLMPLRKTTSTQMRSSELANSLVGWIPNHMLPLCLILLEPPCLAKLPSLEASGLQSAYQKFKAITNATPKVMALGKDAEWKSQFDDGAVWVPSIITFIDIFIAKSQFYQTWKPLFLRAQEYPDMKDWLDEYEDCLSTEDLWGIKTTRALGFPDLKRWLEDKDREGEMKRRDPKGKRKAPDSPNKKNRDRDRPVVQRKHKKLKQARNSDEGEASE